MSLTLLILLVTIAISFAALGNENIFHRGILNPYQVFHRKQYWRLLSSGFLHNGYIHLGFNMFTFFFFGHAVENLFYENLGVQFGQVAFLVFYISAIIVSDLPTAWKHRDNPGYNSLGASGAVSAVLLCSILYDPTSKLYLYAMIPIPGFILGVLYIVYSYSQGKNKTLGDNINHDAHLHGALYGVVFGLIINPSAGPEFFEQIRSNGIF